MINKKRSKKVALVLVCLLIPLGAFGLGYFLNQYNIEKNVAKTLTVEGNIGGTIAEKDVNIENIVPGDTINQSIQFSSTSTASSLIRVKIEPVWEGNLSSNNIEIVFDEGIEKSQDIQSGKRGYWYKCSDGYYYYIDCVKEKNDIKFAKGIKFTGGADDTEANEYQNKNLNIKVTMDMIQSKYSPFEERWNVTDTSLATELDKLCSETE